MIGLICGNANKIPLADQSVHIVVTSPPYWGLRDYGVDGQLGLESTPEQFISNMIDVFREVWRVLRDDGTLWLNLGDSYAGGNYKSGKVNNSSSTLEGGKTTQAQAASVCGQFESGLKPKDLCGIPWRVALALQADGWYLRSDIIWHKPNPMPESVTDRPTKAHEYLFLLTKNKRYFYDADSIREDSKYPDDNRKARSGNGQKRLPTDKIAGVRPGSATYPKRNRRTVWTIATRPYSGAHFATFPPALVEPCIKAGTSEHGVCPECGAGWERVVEKEFTSTSAGRENITGQEFMQGWEGVPRGSNQVTTTGFRPTCTHDLPPIPATVYDPFAGSGTTLQVARQLGRSAVGTDLSLDYLRNQARPRLALDALDRWEYGSDEVESNMEGLPLFGGTP